MPVINFDEYEKFREFFYRQTGIYYENTKFDYVERRIADRIEKTGYVTFRAWFTFMRMDLRGEELQQLTNSLTVNETYFFREEYQFKCLVNSVLDEILRTKKQGERLRIWSMPCATGEEAYSLAIYLMEFWPMIDKVDVELLASDIDTEALYAARQGIYGPRSLQHLPKEILAHYFTVEPDGQQWRAKEDLLHAVAFSQVNLHDLGAVRNMRNLDVIFCRNLLIYFDDISRTKAAESLYDALNPGGFVMLGHSESMSRISSLFTVRRFKDAIVYQKPLTA